MKLWLIHSLGALGFKRTRGALCFCSHPPSSSSSSSCFLLPVPDLRFLSHRHRFQNFAQRSFNDSVFRASCVHYVWRDTAAVPSPLSYPDTLRKTPAQACEAMGWWLSLQRAQHAHSEFRRLFCLEQKDGIPLYDTSLALKVVHSWGQGSRGSLPGGDVVLVTTCTETVTGSTRWSIFLN